MLIKKHILEQCYFIAILFIFPTFTRCSLVDWERTNGSNSKNQLQWKEKGNTQSLKCEGEGQGAHELTQEKCKNLKFTPEYWLNSHLHHRIMVWWYLIHQAGFFFVCFFFFNYFTNHFIWSHFTPLLCQLLKEIRVESLESTHLLELSNTSLSQSNQKYTEYFVAWGIWYFHFWDERFMQIHTQ